MLRVSWDTAFTYLAKAMVIIAERYSGEAGARRLREQGYPPEMIEMTKGSGVRTMKFRAGMPILGVIGKMAIYPDERGLRCLARPLPAESEAQPGARWPVLVQLHLARRPKPSASVLVRCADFLTST